MQSDATEGNHTHWIQLHKCEITLKKKSIYICLRTVRIVKKCFRLYFDWNWKRYNQSPIRYISLLFVHNLHRHTHVRSSFCRWIFCTNITKTERDLQGGAGGRCVVVGGSLCYCLFCAQTQTSRTMGGLSIIVRRWQYSRPTHQTCTKRKHFVYYTCDL